MEQRKKAKKHAVKGENGQKKTSGNSVKGKAKKRTEHKKLGRKGAVKSRETRAEENGRW